MIRPNLMPRYQRRARGFLRKSKARGLQIYKGPSTMPGLRSAPQVLGLVSFYTENLKLGNEYQTWHLRADEHPLNVRREKRDQAICGDCALKEPCYVAGRTLNVLWRSVANGNYPSVEEFAQELRLPVVEALRVLGSMPAGVRFGAYGDPVSMPVGIAQALTHHAGTHQGYTHQWRRLPASPWSRLLMASCERPDQVPDAVRMGYRCYVVYPPELTRKEARRAIFNACKAADMARPILAECPASERAGAQVDCVSCPIQCDGVKYGAPWQVVSAAHGGAAAMGKYRKMNFAHVWRSFLEG